MIELYLNKKYSLRNLSDDEFENIISTLASELSLVDYIPKFNEDDLIKDWEKLCKTKFNTDTTSSVRVGMKLCEHFFPNFFDIRSKGLSFNDIWTNVNKLEKILRWNRKSHTTPYLSELKRGVYFCCGLTKSTMFRPHLAKLITSNLKGDRVLDPCCGWGGRLLGTVASGKSYTGFEPNIDTYNNLISLVQFLGIEEYVTLYNDVVENIENYNLEKFDIILTSPPYFNLEVYSDDPSQSENKYTTYTEWSEGWLKDVICKTNKLLNNDGVSCWNVHNVGKMKIIDDVKLYHNQLNFQEVNEFCLMSSKRQSNGSGKNKDVTKCYKLSNNN